MVNSVMQRTRGSISGPNLAQKQFLQDSIEETPISSVRNYYYEQVDNSFIDRGGEDDDDD